MNIFEREKPDLTLRGSVARSLWNLGMDRERVRLFVAAAEKIKEPFEAPCHRGDGVAHIGFPKRKMAILIPSLGTNSQRISDIKDKWSAAGWDMAYIRSSTQVSVANLEEQLAELLGVSKKRKKGRR